MHITASTPHLARPGIEKIIQTYPDDPMMVAGKLVGPVMNTSLRFVRLYTEGDFPYADIVNDGQPMTFSDWLTPHTMDVTPKMRVLGWEATRLGQTSDQYGIYSKAAMKLRKALKKTYERDVADMFNNAETNSAAYRTPDAVVFLSTAHLLDDGTATGTNKPASDIALGALALEQAIQELAAQVGGRGEPMPAMGPWYLVVPPQLLGVAKRVVESSGLAQTANNDPNALITGRIVDVVMNPWFTSTTAWFLMPAPKSERQLLEVRRQAPQVLTDFNINTKADVWRVDEMFALAWQDWRNTWGTTP